MARSVENVYAGALLSAVPEERLNAVREEAETLFAALSGSPDVKAFLSHPDVPEQAKAELLNGLFEHGASEEMRGFLSVILEKKRESELPAMLERFMREADRKLNRGHVFVSSARPLSKAQQEKIEQAIRSTTDFTSCEFTYTVDETLIGGIVLRIGDRVVDGSVKNRLTLLKRELKATRLSQQ